MKKWSNREKDFVLNNFTTKTDYEIALDLGRSKDSVKKCRQRMDLIKKEEISLSSDNPEDFKKVCGIFALVSTNKKALIISSYDIFYRYRKIMSCIRTGRFNNQDFLNDYNDSFYFTFLEKCPEEALLSRRDHYVEILDSYNKNRVTNPPEIDNEIIDKIKKRTIKNGECIEYRGQMSKNKYGKIKIRGKYYSVHRIMYYHEYNEYPTLLRHTCHNTKCCNPKHLIPGSSRDNSLDSVIEDRKRFEETFLKHKGVSRKISEELGLTLDTVSHKILELELREKHDMPYVNSKNKSAVDKNNFYKEEIKKYFNLYTDKDISLIVGCSENLVKKNRRECGVRPFKVPIKKYGPFLNKNIIYYSCNNIFGSCYDIIAEIFGESERHKHGFEEKSVQFLLSQGYECDRLA